MTCYDHMLDMPGCADCERNDPRRLQAEVERLLNLNAAVAGENERLRAGLIKYGCHTGMCGYEGSPYPHGYHCVCGLYDLIDAGEHLAALGREREGE